MDQKQFETIVFGATGYTGVLASKYLAQHSGNPRWAIAGRDRKRLEALHSKLNLSKQVGIVVAETSDIDSLEKMVSQTKSIVNLAGPFRKLNAENLVKVSVDESR